MLNPTRFFSRFNHTNLPALLSGAAVPDVMQLQQLLQDKGFDPGAIDGHLGGLTQMAIYRFQFAHNLVPTGSVDLDTWYALLAA
jgi:peptidoglycan hydrolase-like protein with peptidoglycan-binding domain